MYLAYLHEWHTSFPWSVYHPNKPPRLSATLAALLAAVFAWFRMFFWYKDCLIVEAASTKSVKLAQRHLYVNHRLVSGAVGPGLRLTYASLLYCVIRHISCLVFPVAQSDLLRIPLIRHTPITTKTASYSLFNKMYVGMGWLVHVHTHVDSLITGICQAYCDTRWRLNRVPGPCITHSTNCRRDGMSATLVTTSAITISNTSSVQLFVGFRQF